MPSHSFSPFPLLSVFPPMQSLQSVAFVIHRKAPFGLQQCHDACCYCLSTSAFQSSSKYTCIHSFSGPWCLIPFLNVLRPRCWIVWFNRTMWVMLVPYAFHFDALACCCCGVLVALLQLTLAVESLLFHLFVLMLDYFDGSKIFHSSQHSTQEKYKTNINNLDTKWNHMSKCQITRCLRAW